MIKGGLTRTPVDFRDFQLGNVFKFPKLSELPEEFSLLPAGIKDQGNTDYCTGFATCSMSEMQEGLTLSPEWSFAVSKMITGDADFWGQNIRTAMKVHVDYGGLPAKDAPYSLQNSEDSFLRKIDNWPKELFKKAEPHKKQSFFEVTGPYDNFDNIRAAIWMFREKKRAVTAGLLWAWELKDIYLKLTTGHGTGHMAHYIGWKKDHLILPNSYGYDTGENGKQYVPRAEVNKNVNIFKAFMFVDMPKNVAKKLNEKRLDSRWSWLVWILLKIRGIFV